MVEKTGEEDRFNGRKSSYAAISAIAVFIPLAACPRDPSLFLGLLVYAILFLISVSLFIIDALPWRRYLFLSTLSMLLVFWATSAALAVYDRKNPVVIRSTARWLIWSNDYKAKVLAQPATANSEMKHIEWDGWGWAGMDTTVYLVFDPTDSLSAAAQSHQPGKFNGIPFAVPLVHRMESHWYTVLFYTDESWAMAK